MKSPPRQLPDDRARRAVEDFIEKGEEWPADLTEASVWHAGEDPAEWKA